MRKEDIHHLADDVHDIARDREEDLKSALTHAEKFKQIQVQDQIDELKVFESTQTKTTRIIITGYIFTDDCCYNLLIVGIYVNETNPNNIFVCLFVCLCLMTHKP